MTRCTLLLGASDFRECVGAQCDANASLDARVDASADSPSDAFSAPDTLDAGKCVPIKAACNPNGAWGKPVPLADFNTDDKDEIGAAITTDGCEMYFAQGPALGAMHIVRARNVDGKFIEPNVVPELFYSEPITDFLAYPSPDGLRLYFASFRNMSGGVYTADRDASTLPWGSPKYSGTLSNNGAGVPYPVPLALYAPKNFYLFRTPIEDGGYGTPVSVDDGSAGINVPVDKAVQEVVASPDELHIYFSSFRLVLYELRIWSSSRPNVNSPWGTATVMPDPINTIEAGINPGNVVDRPTYVTPDDCTLYFSSNRSGTSDMYKVTRLP